MYHTDFTKGQNNSLILNRLVEKFTFSTFNGKLYVYSDGIESLFGYREVTVPLIEKLIYKTFPDAIDLSYKVDKIYTALSMGAAYNFESVEYGFTPYIRFKNIIFDLYEGDMVDISKEIPAFVNISHELNIWTFKRIKYETPCLISETPNFNHLIRSMTWNNKEDNHLICEALAYALCPIKKAKKSIIFYGPAHSGKSVLLKTLETILGNENYSSLMLHQLGEKHSTSEVSGKMANIFHEIQAKPIPDIDVFKALVSCDTLTANPKYKELHKFRSTATIIGAGNRFPSIKGIDSSEGLNDRFLFIGVNEYQGNPDPYLTENISKEIPEILALLCSYIFRLIENDFFLCESPRSKKLKKRFKRSSNSILMFIEDNLTLYGYYADWCKRTKRPIPPREQFRISKKELYSSYTFFCKENLLDLKKQSEFNEYLLRPEFQIEALRRSIEYRELHNIHCFEGLIYRQDLKKLGLANPMNIRKL